MSSRAYAHRSPERSTSRSRRRRDRSARRRRMEEERNGGTGRGRGRGARARVPTASPVPRRNPRRRPQHTSNHSPQPTHKRSRDYERSSSGRSHKRRAHDDDRHANESRSHHHHHHHHRERSHSHHHHRDRSHSNRRRDRSRSYDRRDRSRSHRRRDGSRSHRRRSSPSSPSRDTAVKCGPNGHIIIKPKERITRRYEVVRQVGEGTFGKVLQCWDHSEGQHVAIKVVRNVKRYKDAAKVEIEILHKVDEHSKRSTRAHCCIRLLDWFDIGGHICMIFKQYGLSLFDFLKANHYSGFSMTQTKRIAFQLISAIQFMHSFKLIHTDLKPENVLFVNSEYEKNKRGRRVVRSTDIKLIDFGSATFEYDYHTKVISTRHYRAPEVVMGLGWSYACDMWSIGCILVELYTGDALFQTHQNLEHLAMMERTLGPIPRPMASRTLSKRVRKYFRNGALHWPMGAQSDESVAEVRSTPPLEDLVGHRHPHFVDLVKRLLTYDPQQRISATEALSHSFFSVLCEDDYYTRQIESNERKKWISLMRSKRSRSQETEDSEDSMSFAESSTDDHDDDDDDDDDNDDYSRSHSSSYSSRSSRSHSHH